MNGEQSRDKNGNNTTQHRSRGVLVVRGQLEDAYDGEPSAVPNGKYLIDIGDGVKNR